MALLCTLVMNVVSHMHSITRLFCCCADEVKSEPEETTDINGEATDGVAQYGVDGDSDGNGEGDGEYYSCSDSDPETDKQSMMPLPGVCMCVLMHVYV